MLVHKQPVTLIILLLGTRSSFNIDVQANNSSQTFSENFNVEQMDTTDQNQHSDQMVCVFQTKACVILSCVVNCNCPFTSCF